MLQLLVSKNRDNFHNIYIMAWLIGFPGQEEWYFDCRRDCEGLKEMKMDRVGKLIGIGRSYLLLNVNLVTLHANIICISA